MNSSVLHVAIFLIFVALKLRLKHLSDASFELKVIQSF